MKHYINNILLESGEISVLMHENAETISHHACQTAIAMRQHGIGVLLLNCATSSQRFMSVADRYITDVMRNRSPRIYTRTIYHGNLADEKRYIDDMLDGGDITVLIISGWEWACLDYRKKRKLLGYLREWAERKNIAILIYSQARTEPTVGEFDRGGLGWLASIAYAIQRIEGVEDMRSIPKPPPLIHDEIDREKADAFAQAIVDKLQSYDMVEDGQQEACSDEAVRSRYGILNEAKRSGESPSDLL